MTLGNLHVKGKSLDSYTLNEFTELAKQSRDNQELRIRKSNEQLSNTPLGFIARNFGKTHAISNQRITTAFKHALQNDPKYKQISTRLRTLLDAEMPGNQPLTAAKVKSVIGMADQMLQSRDDAVSLKEMAAEYKLVGKDQLGALQNFAMEYLFHHPDCKLDLGSTLHQNLTAEQRRMDVRDLQVVLRQHNGARLEALATLLKAFYKQAGADALKQAGYGISPAQAGGDAQKAEALLQLLSLHSEIGLKPEGILDGAFDAQRAEIPKTGDIAKPFANALPKLFSKQLARAGLDNDLPALAKMKTEDINRITQTIRAHISSEDSMKKILAVKVVANIVHTFVEQHPALAEQPEQLQQALTRLTDRMVGLLATRNTSLSAHRDAQTKLSVEMLLNEQGLTVNGESLFAKAGIDPKVGLAALSEPAFFNRIIDKVNALGDKRNDEQIAQAVRSEAGRLLEQHAALLQKLGTANLPEALIGAGVKTALALDAAITALRQPEGRNEEQLLEKLQAVASALGDKSLKDADRALLLKNLIGEFAKELPEGAEKLCRDNQKDFARLAGQLFALSQDATLREGTRLACQDVAEITMAVYSQLLDHVPEELQVALALVPNQTGPVNQNLAAGANPLKDFPRNATSAQMFAGFQELEADKALGADKKAHVRRTMETLGCPDHKIVALVAEHTSIWISNAAPALTQSNQDYTDISHLFNTVSAIGSIFRVFQNGAAGYAPEQIPGFLADIFLAELSDEQKRNFLNSLKDPRVQEFLQVIHSYAQKNAALPDNSVDPVLVSLSENGAFMAKAIEVFQAAADKAAQQLGEPAPGPIFDSHGTKTLLDLSKSFEFEENFHACFATNFSKLCNAFDSAVYLANHHLSQNQYDAVKQLYGSLKVPAPAGKLNTLHGQVRDRDFRFTFKDASGRQVDSSWTPNMFASLFAFNADAIAQLLEETQGHPSAGQLWGILHGGQPPAGLTMDNLADKVMRSLCQQVHTLGKVLGKNMKPELFFDTCTLKIGMNPKDLIEKCLQTAHGDVTFTRDEQAGKSGMFPLNSTLGKSYEDGSHHYAFGNDFYRAIMPAGSQPGPNGEDGCKITVQPAQGEPIVFNQSDYEKVPKDQREAYLSKIPGEVEKLCSTKAQLAGVGICTTQVIQGGLRTAEFYYFEVTGGSLEHTALDHHISRLPNGNVLVKVTEKPGTLFKFNMQFEVDPNGFVSTRPESSITLPSLQKVQAFRQTHPGVIL